MQVLDDELAHPVVHVGLDMPVGYAIGGREASARTAAS
jgi:hypothetical protein